MKHDWRDLPYNNNADNMLKDLRRRCANCGAVQTRITHHAWMRITGYQWVPLVGRCTPPRSTPNTGASHERN